MGKTPFWLTNPDAWDRVKIAGLTLPGLAQVKPRKGREVATDKVPGSDGATFTHIGYKPASVEITLVMWEAVHLEKFEQILPSLLPRKGEVAKHVEVVHPKLSMLGIRYLYLFDIEGPDEGAIPETMEIKLSFSEFYPETKRNDVTKKTTTAKGAAAKPVTGAKATPPTPTAPSVARPSRGELGPNRL